MTDPKEDLYEKKEKKKLFSPEGNLIYCLTKAGQIIILNILWFVSCLPVFTIGTATTSLYYAMMKNIRRNPNEDIQVPCQESDGRWFSTHIQRNIRKTFPPACPCQPFSL